MLSLIKYLIEYDNKTLYQLFCAQVAQLVEQRTENPRVGGSIPPLGTTFFTFFEGNFFVFAKINYTAFIREKSKF